MQDKNIVALSKRWFLNNRPHSIHIGFSILAHAIRSDHCFKYKIIMVSNILDSRETYSKVLILGAGISGIAAAKTLHYNAVEDFIILEGSDRIGGRMKHIQWHNTTIELGANWIHGTVNNPVHRLAQEYGIKGKLDRRTVVIRDENGAKVTEKGRLPDLELAKKKVREIVSARAKLGLGDISLEDALKEAGWVARTPEEKAADYWIHEFMEATPSKELSTGVGLTKSDLYKDIDFNHDEQQFFVTDPRGYAHLVDRMAASFLTEQDPRLQLNKRVETIEWSKGSVRVQTSTGEIYRADIALITFSTGVLTSGLVQFQPQLPVWKRQVLSKFEMVTYTKIFLKFETCFWDHEEYTLHASHRSCYAVWQNLEANARFPKGTNFLLITVTGEKAVRLESQSNMKTQNEIMEVLRKVYGPDIPEPVDIFYPRWGADECFLGSWAKLPMGVSNEDLVKMSSPTGALFYAGEATSEHNGTVHGAYLTGVAQGVKISKCVNNNLVI